MLPEDPITPDSPPSIADGTTRRLDPRHVSAQRLSRGVTALVLGLAVLPGLTAVLIVQRGGGLLAFVLIGSWLAAVGLLTLWAWIWPGLAYRYASYSVGETGIEMRRGVVWRRMLHVPRSRVQHTDVSQGPIERSYELGTLVIYTAGTDHARVSLMGLPHTVALRIRDHLLPDRGPDAV